MMSRANSIAVLLMAAILEAAGDAIVRAGLRRTGTAPRLLFFALGASVLFAYGVVVNSPRWDFGALLGLYVVFFFVTAQLISWFAFGQPPSRVLLIGGGLIVAGGLVIAWDQV